MSKKIPGYLKLHTEDEAAKPMPRVMDIRNLDAVCGAFAAATGWQLICRHDRQPSAAEPCRWSLPLDPDGCRLELRQPPPGADSVPAERAEPLADAIGQTVLELQETRHALWQREAELAVAIPVTLRPHEPQQLASGLESVLRGGAEALGCQAAALYLLDEATSHLKLRACWGLPKSRLLDPPRPLRGAVSDLEALVGHAVALEDAALLPHWKAPEDVAAALCVPVSTANTPLGTLWFFCETTREFTAEQTHLAEIIAGRLVSDLEREVLVCEGMRTLQREPTLHAVSVCQNQLGPMIPPLLDGWQVAGRTLPGGTACGDLFDWCVLPDGRLALAVGHCEGDPVEAALSSIIILTALKAHAAHPHNARQMLQRINDTLWTGSAGDRFASLWYGLVDPDQGTLQYATAGYASGVTYCQLTGQSGAVGGEGPLLGFDPDARFRNRRARLDPGQALCLVTEGVRRAHDTQEQTLDEQRLATLLSASAGATAEEQVDALLAAIADPRPADRTAVIARRSY